LILKIEKEKINLELESKQLINTKNKEKIVTHAKDNLNKEIDTFNERKKMFNSEQLI